MAYSEPLATRIRAMLTDHPLISEKKMFGGLAFMLGGNMCCGVVKDELMARVGPAHHNEALALPHARPMDMGGRTMKGMLLVSTEGIASDTDLKAWLDRCVKFSGSLPAK